MLEQQRTDVPRPRKIVTYLNVEVPPTCQACSASNTNSHSTLVCQLAVMEADTKHRPQRSDVAIAGNINTDTILEDCEKGYQDLRGV